MSSARNFLRNEKILLLAFVITFWNLKNTYNYIARTLIAIPQRSTFSTLKSISSYSFWGKVLKLGNYVLGTKTKLLADQNFDIRSRKQNMGFWICRWPVFEGFLATSNVQIPIFSLLGPKSKFWSAKSFVLGPRDAIEVRLELALFYPQVQIKSSNSSQTMKCSVMQYFIRTCG